MAKEKSLGDLLYALGERAKELNCLYNVEEVLSDHDSPLETVLRNLAAVIPPGWQYPAQARVRIRFGGLTVESPDFVESRWVLRASILVQEQIEGSIEVYYRTEQRRADEGPFLRDERRLINTIAERLGHYIQHQRMRSVFQEWQALKTELAEKTRAEWKVVLDMLRRTDQGLYTRIGRKMLHRMCWSGIPGAQALMEGVQPGEDEDVFGESNRPLQREEQADPLTRSDAVFRIAEQSLGDEEILVFIQKWITDDKAAFLVNTVESLDSSLPDVADALARYYHLYPEGIDLNPATDKGLRVSLIRRFFSDQLPFINIAKQYMDLGEFYDLSRRIVAHQKSHGKLGGKSSGLFLASHILAEHRARTGAFANVRTPKTWYIASDGIIHFIHYNNLEEVFAQKYLPIEQVREEYPSLISVFKNATFPPDIVKGLSVALDDLGDTPLIVRSSSLLEDSLRASFSGKYKSLFIANTGTKEERLAALLDAVAEVYASIFGPDPLEYRAERGLLDFHEQMGIMIQQVVGVRVGRWFFPSFAGVAFSNNEFRWSPRIRREDGLLRIVPGLGTRAVDRLGDDYPILVAPGQANLRVNITPEEQMRYSPKNVDVIDLEEGGFVTVELATLLRECGESFPAIHQIVSKFDGEDLRHSFGLDLDFARDAFAVTFHGLITGGGFVEQMRSMLRLLQDTLGVPVDLEFASDGRDLYLLQCRPQSFSASTLPAAIPHDIPRQRIVFSANRYISNGSTPDVTHIVYVDPAGYAELPSHADLYAVGRCVSRLNKLLPKHQFILMGPGRWGSRGDIKLGVSVTYSDINNTAMLVEIARAQGNYLPDLSFGTHFFQDLVEASIRYLPLYPDDEGVAFNERFLLAAHNILPEIAPEFAHLANTVRVIDVPTITDGMVLRVLMNADLEEAIAFLDRPSRNHAAGNRTHDLALRGAEDHWSWRQRMSERLALQLPAARFGVRAMYVFGSTKNGTAGPASDIDLIVHTQADEQTRRELLLWFEGWSLCLAEINFLRTGYKVDQLLDVHLVTDEDIAQRTSFAARIDAVSDRARPLVLRKE